ncbi:MAG: serine--tRNA ligase, partial [Acidimicrobiia bacterium]|nr:serine--tRNA ligase [Acidimicrobiia bacterium]
MIDIRWIRERPAELKDALIRRNMDPAIVDVLVRLDEERRAIRTLAEDKRAEQKALGREIAKLEGDERERALEQASKLSEDVSSLTTEADAADEIFLARFAPLPNPPHESVPMGDGEED